MVNVMMLLGTGDLVQCMVKSEEESPLVVLPCERLCEIFTYLDSHSLARVALTCKNGAAAVGEVLKKEIIRIEAKYADLQKKEQESGALPKRSRIMCSGIRAWLIEAAREGLMLDLRFLVFKKKLDINAFDDRGDTVLRTLVCIGNTTAVERLVAVGADLEKGNVNGITPLMFAVLNGSEVGVVRRMIELGADVCCPSLSLFSSGSGWVSQEVIDDAKEFAEYTIFDLAQDNVNINEDIRSYLLELRSSRHRESQCVCL